MTALSNLDSRTLVTRIADLLREQIIAGQLEPGARIRQDEFAAVLGVSRTPLREAFRLLEAEGWIQTRPRSGVTVSTFSATEVQEILAMRLLLEPLAIRVAAINHSADEAASLQQLLSRWCAAPFESPTQATTFDATNQEFHFALYRLQPQTNTDSAQASLRGYWDRYSRFRHVYYGRTAGSISHSNDEHVAILDAWLQRDPDQAEILLAKHILRAGRALVRTLAPDEPMTPQLCELSKRYLYTQD